MIFVAVDLQYMTNLRGIDFAASLSYISVFFLHGSHSCTKGTSLGNLLHVQQIYFY
jgi:hypothetical protein